jgi:tetratricopeptide (TPR) repeat protein
MKTFLTELASVRLVLLALCLRTACLGATGPEAAFEAGNKLYEEGKFAEAASAYDKLLLEGNRSAALFYNLGTACYKAGHLGRAIAAYRQAELLSPRDTDLRANLQFVRQRVNGEDKSPLPSWRSWMSFLTLNEGAVLAAAAFWAWFLLLAAGEFRPAWRRSLGGARLTAGILSVLLAACLGLAAYVRLGEISAVVIKREAVVRFGPLDESQTAFTLPDGAEVTVLDTKDAWLQIRQASKRVGWVKRDQVVVLSGTGFTPKSP